MARRFSASPGRARSSASIFSMITVTGPDRSAALTKREPKTSSKFGMLNKTNAIAIASSFGKNMKEWIGHGIVLKPEMTLFGGKQTPCIRVYPLEGEGEVKRADADSAKKGSGGETRAQAPTARART